MTALSWANEYRTLRQKAPVLVRFLDACIPKESSRRQCTIMTCIGVWAKSHCRNTLLHAFISLVLSYGHAGKLVCALGVIDFTSYFKLFMVHTILIGVFKAPETWLMSL